MKKMIVEAVITACLLDPPDRGSESIHQALAAAVASGDQDRIAHLRHTIANRNNNPIVARLTVDYSPSMRAAQEEAAKLKRNPALSIDFRTNKVRPASLGLYIPDTNQFSIDLTAGGMSQLGKSLGVNDVQLLSIICVGQKFEAIAELREMGEIVVDNSPEGRATGREITIQTGNANFTNQRLVLDGVIGEGQLQIMQVFANAERKAKAETATKQVLRPRAIPRVFTDTGKGSTPSVPLFEIPGQKEKETDEKYAKRVAAEREAFAIKYHIDVADIQDNVTLGNSIVK